MPRHANGRREARPVVGHSSRPVTTGRGIMEVSAGLGTILYRFRRLLWGLIAGAAGAFVWSLRSTGQENAWQLLFLLALIWLSFLVAFAHLMSGKRPPVAPADSGVLGNVAWRIRQLLAWVLLALMGSLACVLIVFTLRAVSVING